MRGCVLIPRTAGKSLMEVDQEEPYLPHAINQDNLWPIISETDFEKEKNGISKFNVALFFFPSSSFPLLEATEVQVTLLE